MPKADRDAWMEARRRMTEQLVAETAAAVARDGEAGRQHGLARLELMQDEDDRWVQGYVLAARQTATREISAIVTDQSIAA
ncbi:hypothetical protein [Roseococcus pinisoli]|uniref:Uncharacterized protein n=1 Tax=Roseococcus pinisoli TaxID=2835040 RepID=A0ABS5QK39_9PROT|nr:hypothetical protein [Roseococcus pinisoli]MBS7812883.1 hypothetical protein [Roseococcus pinisoli]